VAPSLQRHRQAFGEAPQLYGSDRGFFSEQNLTSCKRAGVKVVCIPQRGWAHRLIALIATSVCPAWWQRAARREV
jgi:hypothetical protein